jgi:hypothetical protein
MPSGHVIDGDSQIQQRMHQEYVIGLLKASSSWRIRLRDISDLAFDLAT